MNKLFQKIKNESGQSIILISVVILSFLMFFGFAINTGLLIAAKISLQNAADAAAYAGAATQARQLNAISYLNYDMRRQYKKFLFRYNFVGSIGSPGFPASASSGPEYDFPKKDYSASGPGQPPQLRPIKVPVVCIPLTTNGTPNDNCLQVNLPNTESEIKNAFPNGGLTQITQALLQQVQQIQQVQQNICSGQGQVNLFVLMSWLFRGDVDRQTLVDSMNLMLAGGGSNITQADRDKAIDTVSALVSGLGLFPRNIITLMRIETLETFLNQPPQSDVSQDKIAGWEKSEQAERYERTIQAYKSALSNLNSSVMSPADVTVTELESPNQFQHEPLQIDFNAYVQMMTGTANAKTICNAAILPFPAKAAPVGIKRSTTPAVTHYAVKVKAKAKLLFLPMKDGIELEAVAGAKPFGSRVGPSNIAAADFIDPNRKPAELSTGAINDCTGSVQCKSPNLKLGGNNTFYTKTFLQSLFTIAKNGQQSFGYAGIAKAQNHATAPNPLEIGLYNILPPAQSEMSAEFIPYSTSQSSSVYRFYAPLYPAGESNPSDRIQKLLDKMFASTSVGNNPLGFNEQDVKASLKSTIDRYLAKLQTATSTENQESLTFAAIELPMQQPGSMNKNKDFWLTEANEVLSSWSRTNPPRFGYSVKFVTLQNLLSSQVGMPDADGDLEKVSH